jgi:hypothetical protein
MRRSFKKEAIGIFTFWVCPGDILFDGDIAGT